MKLMPTLEGGLRIEIETPGDWMVLEHIQYDALDGGENRLPQRLGALMDEQSEWEEVVIPELKSLFNGQVSCVVDAPLNSRERGSRFSPENFLVRNRLLQAAMKRLLATRRI